MPKRKLSSLCDGGGIFINYRRCDSSGNPRDHALFVEALSHELADHFGTSNVFIDTSSSATIKCPNELRTRVARCKCTDELRTKLTRCDVLLVVLHAEWLEDLQQQKVKLASHEFDRIHQEISSALTENRHSNDQSAHLPEVIPVLLENADLPKHEELPEDIRELVRLQAFRLRFSSLTTDLPRLIAELEIHAAASWPPFPTPDSSIQKLRPTDRKEPGWGASRGLPIAAFVATLPPWMPKEESEWISATELLLWSTITITGTLLGAIVATMLRKTLHQMESYIHSLPIIWLLIVRMGLVVMVIILFLPLAIELDPNRYVGFIVGSMGSFTLAFYAFFSTISKIQEDNQWPPLISLQPRTIRRAIARLEHHLTFLWQPPLSCTRRKQASWVIGQVNHAVSTLRATADCRQTRWQWLRTGCPRLAVGYSVWLTITLGLAVASMHENSSEGYPPSWYYLSIPIGILACGLGILTMELIFQNDREARQLFIEEIDKIKNGIETGLKQYMPTSRVGQP